jgi:selenium-binding protein 1
MGFVRPDQSFYPSARAAGEAPPETHGYVTLPTALDDPRPDALGVIDLDPGSPSYGTLVSRVELPHSGDELHHFGWNACSSALCPYAPHAHVERRYLIVPGLRSSRITILDTKDDPLHPRVVKVIEPETLARRAGYSRPHTVHCGPDGIYVNALGGTSDGDGPGGIFRLDHDSFDVLGRWEVDRGPQFLAYDFAWHLGYDTMITSEWGTPAMVENGVVPELLLGKKYGRSIHVWDLRRRRHVQTLSVGEDDQMVLELRPAHDPTKAYGFVGVVTSVANLSASIWLWHLAGRSWELTKVIEIPAEPAEASVLPPLLQGFGAVPPLVTDINLSLDDRFLYVSAWGTGEFLQYDVSDPFHPRKTGSVHLGGIVRRAAHGNGAALSGGPQMVEVSRDGRRVYVTNSLYLAWDQQFYPEGIEGWMVKLDADTENGGLSLDPGFHIDTGTDRAHQVRLAGGDASSDSYCYP